MHSPRGWNSTLETHENLPLILDKLQLALENEILVGEWCHHIRARLLPHQVGSGPVKLVISNSFAHLFFSKLTT